MRVIYLEALLIIGIILLIANLYYVKGGNMDDNEYHYKKTYINNVCKKLLLDGHTDELLSFLNKYTNNKEISFHILNNALSKNIPVDILFSLAYNESRYKAGAISKININGSRDYGLFQLNGRVYRRFKRKYLLNISNNCILASAHLLYNYNAHKDWSKALIMYNNGNIKRVPKRTYVHVLNILSYAERFKDKFYKTLPDKRI